MAVKQTKNRNKDRLATEERLLWAAEQIFSKHGFKGATTRMIAKKADVNVALIARYFDGKYGLMMKIIEKKALDSRYTSLSYPSQATLTEECLKFAIQRVQFYEEDLNLFRIILVQFLTDAKFLKKFQESLIMFETHPEFEARLSVLIADKKMVSTHEPLKILNMLEDQMFGLIVGKLLIHNTPIEQIISELKEFILLFCSALEIKQ